jgi:integrase
MSITIREKKLKSGKKSLYLDIYKDGQRRYDFLGLYLTGNKQEDKETMQLAENIKAKRQLEMAHNDHGFTPSFKKKANFIEYFENDAETFGKGTKKQYNNVLNKLKDYGGESIKFGAVDRRFCEGFKAHLLEELNPNTARVYFAMFKAVLNRAVRDEIISENPADKVTGVKAKNGRKIEYLTIDELRTLAGAECPHSEVKAAFLFSCHTGLRWSDVEPLSEDDIVDQQIEIHQTKTGGAGYLPLSKQALKILDGRSGERLFDLPTNAQANRVLKDWASNAELERWKRIKDNNGNVIQRGLTYHVSRHTFAVQVLASGGDIYTLKELLGHQSVQSTEVYAQVVNKAKEDAVNNMPEVNYEI